MRRKSEVDKLVAQAYLQGIYLLGQEIGVAQLTEFVFIGLGEKYDTLTQGARQEYFKITNECYLDIHTIWMAYKVGALSKLYALIPTLTRLDTTKIPKNVQEYLYNTVVAAYFELGRTAPPQECKPVATMWLPKRPLVKNKVMVIVQRQYADLVTKEGVVDYVQACVKLTEDVHYTLLSGRY